MQDKDQAHWDEIIRAVRQGDRERFRDIVREFQEPLRFVVSYFVRGSAEQIEEVVHCAFVNAYHKLHEFQLGQPLAPWLKAIAKHCALKEIRRLRRTARLAGEVLQAELMKTREEAEPPFDDLAKLRRCIEKLKDDAREMVRLRYFEGKDFEAIADTLGRSAGALRVAMLQVRRLLKVCMERS
jgi:RNA polymerase sigma-70 factor (ECF subfamily)